MTENKKPAEKLLKKLSSKYRLVVMNDETFEEVSSFRLTRFNIYILLSTLLVILVTLITSVIVFTPLRQYIPGYSDIGIRKKVLTLTMKTDSLESIILANDTFLVNIQNIINGGVPIDKIDTPVIKSDNPNHFDTINLKRVSPTESKLRKEMEKEGTFSLNLNLSHDQMKKGGNNITDFYFFPPLKGYITNEFNPRQGHYGVDIVAPENEPIKSVLDGVVVFSGWTTETGYVIIIQHSNNLISLYKHNSVLLKKEGASVKAGDVIAIIGNTGELTTGPHLHFELWYNGIPINPKDYIVFN